MKAILIIAAIIFTTNIFAQIKSDKIYLNNGDSITGTIQKVDAEHYRITKEDGKSVLVLSSMIKASEKIEGLKDTAGDQLLLASKKTYTGNTIIGVGVIIAVIGGVSAPMVAIIGGGVVIVGAIYSITAWKNISKAGRILKSKGI